MDGAAVGAGVRGGGDGGSDDGSFEGEGCEGEGEGGGGEGESGGSGGNSEGGDGGEGGAKGEYVRQKHCLFREPIPGSGSVPPKATPVSASTKPFLYQHLPTPVRLYPTVRPVAIIISMVVASIQYDELVIESSFVYRGP